MFVFTGNGCVLVVGMLVKIVDMFLTCMPTAAQVSISTAADHCPGPVIGSPVDLFPCEGHGMFLAKSLAAWG